MEIQEIRSVAEAIRGEIAKAVIGQEEVVELLLTSLLVGGHILLEGVPGTAKTLLAQSFAASLHLDFGRIQFAPISCWATSSAPICSTFRPTASC